MLSDLEYFSIAQMFSNMKAIHGPEFVNATLKRHKDIYFALQDYEKRYIVDLESNLLTRSSKDDESN